MLNPIRVARNLLALAAVPVAAMAQNPAQNQANALNLAQASAAADVIGSQQIDRFEAIKILQQSLKSDPKNVADWISLGELAHEVALEMPSGQDDAYYKMSLDAYEHALKLDPENRGLKAAVQFARDQEAGEAQFDEARKKAAEVYVSSRRRELERTGNTPSIPVYGGSLVAAVARDINSPQARGAAPNPPSRTLPGPAPYPSTYYQPFYTPQGQPYTYQQYANTYRVPAGAANPPTTLRGLTRQLPNALRNDVERAVSPPAPPGNTTNPGPRPQ